jgi:TonB-linked SusC/RagA family outer membrane protein
VRIRGGTSINANSDPIFVVDGFVGATMPPPEDVESIEVLKDASATAIYGSRGANGVILVTTKRGKSGKSRIEFNSSFSSQEEVNRLDLLNAEQFKNYIAEVRPSVALLDHDTDWQEEIFRRGGLQNYQLSFSGGSDKINYYISGSYFDQSGVVLGSEDNRFSLTSNIGVQATEKLNIGLNIFGQRTDQDGTRSQETSGGSGNTGVVAGAFKFEPDQAIYDENGNFTVARLNDPHDNPYAVATQYENEVVNDRFQGNLFAEYDILKDLKFRVTVGATTNSGRTGTYTPTTLNSGRSTGGSASIEGRRTTLLQSENYLTYTRSFIDKHNVGLMAGYSYQESRTEEWRAASQSMISDAFSYWNLGASAVQGIPTSSLEDWKLASFYGRANYSFSDKYLITFNARYDGSSILSEGHKWSFFPSGAIAWNMSNESFMSGLPWVSQWKWRASYGLTGNQSVAPYETFARFGSILSVVNGVQVSAVTPSAVANQDLTWETTAQLDIGADISFFDDRINLSADYYRKVTSDLLFELPLPQYSGYSNQLKNIGKVENKGFELALGAKVLTGPLRWNTDFNISMNRNKVLRLPDGNDILYGSGPGHMLLNQTQILREGSPVGSFYGWVYDGVYQQDDTFTPGSGFEQVAGGEKFRDIKTDNILNSDDRTIIGNPHPDFIWGWNNDLTWKNFDLNIFFQASQGNDILSYTMMELDLLSGLNNATTNALRRWTPDNTDTDVPKAATGRTRRVSTRWIYDGSFIRLKNLSLGYNIPPRLLERAKISRLKIFVSAQNILTITDYEGYDPEVNYRSATGQDSNRNLGLDYGSYPNAKAYTVGLNLGF